MTLLAGFDMVIEISRSALEGLIGSANLGSQSLTPPTEIHQASGPNSIDLMILQPLSLSLSPGETNWATISIPFEDSTFTLSGTTLGPVKGTLSIAGFFDMLTVDGTDPSKPPFAQQVAFFPKAVTHAFDTSVAYTANALNALADRTAFEQTIDADLSVALAGNPLPAGPLWMIDPTQNGTLGGRFCAAGVDVIGTESIGLFGTLLTVNEGSGDSTQATSVLGAGESVAVSLSPSAFHDLVWCPQWAGAAAAALAKQPAKLAQFVAQNAPPDCGSGELPLPGGTTLSGTSIQFGDGVIHMSGNVFRGNEGAYCFRVDVSFQTDLSFEIQNGKIVPNLSPNPPNSQKSIDVSWYCALVYLVAAAIGGAVSLAIVTFVYSVATSLIDIVLSSQAIPALSPNPVSVGFAGIGWTSVAITTEGLTLHGDLPAPTPILGPGRQASLAIAVSPTATTKVGSGIYHYPGSKACPPAQFAYDENAVDLSVVCAASVTMIGTPRTFTWTIGDSPPAVLTGSSGTVDVEASVSLPSPDGVYQQLGQKSVSIDYEVSSDGSTLTLTDKNHLVYSLLVRVDCSDTSGASVAAWQEIELEGDVIQFGSDYADFMRKCMIATQSLIDMLRTLPEGVPRGGDPGQLSVAQLVSVVSEGVRENMPGLSAALSEISAVGGPSLRGQVLGGAHGSGAAAE